MESDRNHDPNRFDTDPNPDPAEDKSTRSRYRGYYLKIDLYEEKNPAIQLTERLKVCNTEIMVYV